MLVPLIYESAAGHLRRWSSKANAWVILTARRMPMQSNEESMRDFVKEWPSAKVGVKIALSFWASAPDVEGEKKAAMKLYSKAQLEMRPMLKCKKGVSR